MNNKKYEWAVFCRPRTGGDWRKCVDIAVDEANIAKMRLVTLRAMNSNKHLEFQLRRREVVGEWEEVANEAR